MRSEGDTEAGRLRLASAPDTAPETLLRLARDGSVLVRAAVAANPVAVGNEAKLLAADADERVRGLLAAKLARLMPGLTAPAQERMREQVTATLVSLVEDTCARVRTAISDIVKEMPEAPRAIILRLARDAEISVCEPVIRLSPLLDSEDLLALLAESPHPTTARCVARRADLPESVSDAIINIADSEAIRLLLGNHSAAIREATLDALIARAADETNWHERLVRRPKLSASAAQALAGFVAAQLLAVLAERADLDPPVLGMLRMRLDQRLREAPAGRAGPDPTLDEATADAFRMRSQGKLTEEALIAAARRGETRMLTAMLAIGARVPPAVVERASALRSTKGLVSLVWKAGFSMRAAGPVQSVLARLPPNAILPPTPEGGFPLSFEEMRWQLEFLGRAGR